MSEPTLDGMTAERLLGLCEETATNHMLAESVARGIVMPEIMVKTIRAAAFSGANAMFQELADRGLILERS